MLHRFLIGISILIKIIKFTSLKITFIVFSLKPIDKVHYTFIIYSTISNSNEKYFFSLKASNILHYIYLTSSIQINTIYFH